MSKSDSKVYAEWHITKREQFKEKYSTTVEHFMIFVNY